MAQLIVTATFLIQKGGTLGGRQIERGDEQLLHALHARAGLGKVFASKRPRHHGANETSMSVLVHDKVSCVLDSMDRRVAGSAMIHGADIDVVPALLRFSAAPDPEASPRCLAKALCCKTPGNVYYTTFHGAMRS